MLFFSGEFHSFLHANCVRTYAIYLSSTSRMRPSSVLYHTSKNLMENTVQASCAPKSPNRKKHAGVTTRETRPPAIMTHRPTSLPTTYGLLCGMFIVHMHHADGTADNYPPSSTHESNYFQEGSVLTSGGSWLLTRLVGLLPPGESNGGWGCFLALVALRRVSASVLASACGPLRYFNFQCGGGGGGWMAC